MNPSGMQMRTLWTPPPRLCNWTLFYYLNKIKTQTKQTQNLYTQNKFFLHPEGQALLSVSVCEEPGLHLVPLHSCSREAAKP